MTALTANLHTDLAGTKVHGIASGGTPYFSKARNISGDYAATEVALYDASGNPLLSSAVAAGDALANPTAGGVLAFPHTFDGTAWRRLRSSLITDAQAEIYTPLVGAVLLTKDGTGAATYPVRSLTGGGDSLSTSYRGPVVVNLPTVYSTAGSDWDRLRSYEGISGVGPTGIGATGLAAQQQGTSTIYPVSSAKADAGTVSPENALNVAPAVWVATADLMTRKGNTAPTAIISQATRTGSVSSSLQLNPNSPGVTLFLAVSGRPGDPTETLTIGIDTTYDAGASWVGMVYFGATAFGGSTGVYMVQVHPGAVDNFTHHYQGTAQFALPFHWRVTILHSAAGSWTYAVYAALHAT